MTKTAPHTHAWNISISEDGKTATVKCTADDCSYTTDQEYTVSIAATGKTYDGTAVTAEITKSEGNSLPFDAGGPVALGNIKYAGRDGTEYSESETAPVNAGKYTASVTVREGTGAKTIQVDYEIAPVTLTEDMVTITESSYEYDGNAKTPTVTVKKDESTTLTLDTDYTISSESVTNASALSTGNGYPVIVSGKGNYTGTITKYWKITKSQPVRSGELTVGALTYGQALADSTITGKMVDRSDDTMEVAGTFVWKVPTTVPQVSDSNTTEYDVVFTPDSSNYGAVELKAKVTVNPKALTVKADDQTRIAGADTNPVLTYTVTGLVGTDTKESVFRGTLACTADQSSPVGTYDITQGTLAVENGNYSFGESSFTKGTMTVVLPNMTVDTIQPGNLSSDRATLNGSVSPAAYATSGNLSSVGFKYRKAGDTVWESVEGTAGNTFRAEITGLTADSDYEYYAVMMVNGEATEKKGKTITFHTEKAVKTDTGKITVKVRQDANIAGSSDVVVSVEKGNDVIASKDLTGVTMAESTAEFEKLPDGSYNVVTRTKDGDFTETKMLQITNGAAVTAEFTILKGKIAAVVEVKGEADTPKVAVDGLNDILSDEDKSAAADGSKEVEVKLDVEKKTETDAQGSTEIKSLLSSKEEIGTYLDLSLFKTVTDLSSGTAGTQTNIGNTNTKILCIAIPYVFTGRSGFFMARYHGNAAAKMDKFTVKPTTYTSEGYFLDLTAGYIFLYASGFSTYAIGYEKKSSGGGGVYIPVYSEPTASPTANPTASPTPEPTVSVEPTASTTPVASGTPESVVSETPVASVEPAVSAAPVASGTPEPAVSETPVASVEPAATIAPTKAPVQTMTPAEKKQAAFALNAGLKVVHNGKSATVKWGEVNGADFYKVYAAYCGNKKNELVKKVAVGKTLKVTFKKLYGKKLSTTKNIRVYVAAYQKVGAKDALLTKSITAHVVGKKNTKYSNAVKIMLSKTSYTLKKGKTVTIKAKTILQYPDRKQLGDAHAKEFRFVSTDKTVAVVNKKGKISTKKKGKCIIYVYARNGLAKEIKVTVN